MKSKNSLSNLERKNLVEYKDGSELIKHSKDKILLY